jgi:hypothetical protein
VRCIFKGRRLAVALVFLGVVLLVVAWRASGYLSNLVLNVGTAVLLFAPLLYLQRLVEERVTRVQQETSASVAALTSQAADVGRQVDEASARLDELSESTMDRLRQAQDRDAQAFATFEDKPSRDALMVLLDRAQDLRAIDPAGVRVRVPGTPTRLRFLIDRVLSAFDGGEGEASLLVKVESLGGLEEGRAEWRPCQPPDSSVTVQDPTGLVARGGSQQAGAARQAGSCPACARWRRSCGGRGTPPRRPGSPAAGNLLLQLHLHIRRR